MKRFASAAVGIAVLGITGLAGAQVTGRFGESGTLAVHVATGAPMLSGVGTIGSLGATPTLGFSTTEYADPENCVPAGCSRDKDRFTSIYLNPRIHYFIIDNLSIGGEVLVASISGKHIEERPNSTTERDLSLPDAFGIMPLVGYNIAIGDLFSIWPQGGIGFRKAGYVTGNPPNEVDVSESWWFLNVDVPFLLHVAPHFAIGAGPGATFTLSRSQSAKQGGTTITTDGYGTTQWRWLNAHVIGWF